MRYLYFLVIFFICFCTQACINKGEEETADDADVTIRQSKHTTSSKFMSYKGLVMAGYQGWFNCEGDGADRGWTHYSKNGEFEDGSCTIDYWPEMDEYEVKYKTPFTFADGSPAYVFSSYDESTVDLAFSMDERVWESMGCLCSVFLRAHERE
jgi:hypothetical protein